MTTRVSAGILLFRHREGRLEVLLVHPGGPFFKGKDLGYWSIPKGEPHDPDEDLELTARREFEEETGQPVPAGSLIPLGCITQRGGKVVHAWAVEGEIDPATMSSNLVEMKWPPLAGREIRFPEVDRWVYFEPAEARRRINETQLPLLERLAAALSDAPETTA